MTSVNGINMITKFRRVSACFFIVAFLVGVISPGYSWSQVTERSRDGTNSGSSGDTQLDQMIARLDDKKVQVCELKLSFEKLENFKTIRGIFVCNSSTSDSYEVTRYDLPECRG